MSPRKIVGLHEPVFAGNEWRYVKECLDTRWVSSAGSYVDAFERIVAERTGVPHAVAIVNGTAALQLALELAGVEPGDEVIVPSLTFIATAHAVIYRGAVPRFLDVEDETFGLDPAHVSDFLTAGCRRRGKSLFARDTGRRVAACVPMHALGHPARVDRIGVLCRRAGIPMVEDAAESLGTTYLGRPAGSFGAMGILSFNGNKIVTTGGGGMIVTANARLAARARHLSTQAKSDGRAFWHDAVGYNFRLPNLNAAVGVAQLERLDALLAAKRRLAGWYRDALRSAPGLRLVWEPKGARSNFWLNTIVYENPRRAAGALKTLEAEGFQARPLWAPGHLQPHLRSSPRGPLEVTERLWRTSVSVPSSADLTRAAAERIARIARGA